MKEQNYTRIIWDGGYKKYYLEDIDGNLTLHRIDGPAVYNIFSLENWWYYYGQRISATSQEEFEKMLKIKAFW